MALEEDIRERIDKVVTSAQAVRDDVADAKARVVRQVDERTAGVMQNIEDRADQVRREALEARDRVQAALRAPENAQAAREDARVVARWVNQHVQKLNDAGVRVDVPQEVLDVVDRLAE